MADGDINPNDIENLGNQVGRTSTLVDGLLKSLRPVYDMLSKTFGGDATRTVEKYTSQLGEMSNKFQTLKQRVNDLTEGNLKFVVQFNGMEPVEAVDRWTRRFQEFSQFISDARIFDKFSVDSASALNNVSENIQGIQDGLKKLGVNVNLNQALIQNAAQAEKLENNFIGLAASTGTLNDLFDGGGAKLKDLTALTSAYSERVANVADATGFSVSQSLAFSAALGQIPGAMDKIVQVGDRTIKDLSSLQVAMTLMSGSGRSQKDVIEALNVSYEKLGQAQGVVSDSAQQGAQMFALISQSANVLGLRFDDVKNVIEGIAEQFKFVGNESDAAARILARYTDALRETGLTSKSSVDIIQQMVKGIGDINIGTKAFISLRTGGPGGLQGAFRFEQLIREGKLDQVVRQMETVFRQQAGGRIFTLAQAAQSPEAAAGFMRQRQMLQSGVFGIGRGFSDDQATRFLEALGKRGLGGGSDAATMLANSLKPGQDALTAVNERGASVQERSWNELKRANNFLERNAVAAELTAGMNIRQFFGATGAGAGRLQSGIRGATERAQRGTTGVDALTQGIGTSNNQETIRQLIMLGRQAMQEGLSAGAGITEGIGRGGAAIGTGFLNTVKEFANIMDEANNEVEMATPPPTGAAQTRTMRAATERVVAQNTREAAQKALGPQKIVLEIQGLEDLNVVVKEKPENVDVNAGIQNTNKRSMTPPGY